MVDFARFYSAEIGLRETVRVFLLCVPVQLLGSSSRLVTPPVAFKSLPFPVANSSLRRLVLTQLKAIPIAGTVRVQSLDYDNTRKIELLSLFFSFLPKTVRRAKEEEKNLRFPHSALFPREIFFPKKGDSATESKE